MKRIVLAALALVLSFPAGMPAQQMPANAAAGALTADDQAALRGLVNGFAEAWNRHDMKAMHDLDTDDVQWVNVVGHYWVGKDTVRRGHTAIHKGMDAKTTVRVESTSVHAITPDVAIVVATLHFKGSALPPPPGAPDTKTRGSFTMVKRGGTWKIVQFQNTIVDPNAEQFDLPSFAETGFSPPSKP